MIAFIAAWLISVITMSLFSILVLLKRSLDNYYKKTANDFLLSGFISDLYLFINRGVAILPKQPRQ